MRFIIIVILPLLLTACGFTPVHQTKSAAVKQQHITALQQVKVAVPTTGRLGQLYRIALEDAVHPGNEFANPAYRLTSEIQETLQPIIIERDARVSRYNLILESSFSLVNVADNSVVHRGRRMRTSSYNVSDSDFATFAALRDARKNGVVKIAEMIAMEAAAALAESAK